MKIAKNAKGIEQNDTESVVSMQDRYSDVVANVFDYDKENSIWIVCEYAKNTNIQNFEKITGINFQKFCEFLDIEDQHYNFKVKMSKEERDFMYENSFVFDLMMLMQNYDMLSGDLCKIDSYGEVVRNNKSYVVLRDSGLIYDTFNKMYPKYLFRT